MLISLFSAARKVRCALGVTIAFAAAVCCLSVQGWAFDASHILSEDQVKIVKRVTPQYPVIAKQLHLAGKVLIDLTVNDDGSVDSAKTVSGSPVLGAAAMTAGKGWKFEPMKVEADGSKPVVRVTFNFAMQ